MPQWPEPVDSLLAVLVYGLLVTSMAPCVRPERSCHPTYYRPPRCDDHPDGYGCTCGVGYYWNTHTCVALGINSMLDFSDDASTHASSVQYTLLLGKSFPEIASFTIVMWIRSNRSQHPGTVLSYRSHDKPDLLRIISGPTVRMQILDETLDAGIELTSNWTHVAWTWNGTDGTWAVYVNSSLEKNGVTTKRNQIIPAGGELLLGQASRVKVEAEIFDQTKAFRGQLAFANIWREVKNISDIESVYSDCYFLQCGDVVEWADFRSGTRGNMKIRWPSTVFKAKTCYTQEVAGQTCDTYCSQKIGAQCNAEILENVSWGRTPADYNMTVGCPGNKNQQQSNTTALDGHVAVRPCYRTKDNRGVWGKPIMDACVTEEIKRLRQEMQSLLTMSQVNLTALIEVTECLSNITSNKPLYNPIDIATVIDTVDILVQLKVTPPGDKQTIQYGKNRGRRELTLDIPEGADWLLKTALHLLDNTIDRRNEVGWRAMQPQGSEGDQLTQVMEHLADVTANHLEAPPVGDFDEEPSESRITVKQKHLAINVRRVRPRGTTTVRFPDTEDNLRHAVSPTLGTVAVATTYDINRNISLASDDFSISAYRLTDPEILPNHDMRTKSKVANVNSAILGMRLHYKQNTSQISLGPLDIYLPYTDNFNISNPKCVRLKHKRRIRPWSWTSDGCHLVRAENRYAMCQCDRPGFFAVITDMFNENWRPAEVPIVLMEIQSYVGCSVSAILCLTTVVLLLYHRCSSKTTAIHKNFALAIVCAQVTFMTGITQFKHPVMCKAFAIAFHYFFLAMFSWLMNEAFNFYIVITYAAHAHGDQSEAGSQWRYYILGWILPGILVGAFVGTHTDDYYAENMCWIAWKYVWLFLGPAVGILSVTMLVLIFTAKEHHESAYTKSEKTNKMILIHNRALWTQMILLTLCWAFAFLTLKMTDSVLKYLYAMFNCLQGAFFLVFYFLLNDEVQKRYKTKRKKRRLSKQGFDYPEQNESSVSEHMIIKAVNEEDGDDEAGETKKEELEMETASPAAKGPSKWKRLEVKSASRKQKSNIEASSEEEGSDCEMIVTSV